MGDSLHDGVLKTLIKLNNTQFKNFSLELEDILKKHGFHQSTDEKLRSLTREYATELLIDHFQDDAISAVTDIILRIEKKQTVASLEEHDKGKLYKEALQKKFAVAEPYNPCLEDQTQYLENEFVDLAICFSEWEKEEFESFLRMKGSLHEEIIANNSRQGSNIRSLFDVDKNGKRPKNIVLEGIAGIGKTYTARHILFQWASGELYQCLFNYVFYIKCSTITSSQANGCLSDLLFDSLDETLQSVKGDFLEEPEKILFILDDFHELSIPDGTSLSKALAPQITLNKVISRQSLPEASLLIMTKPGMQDRLNSVDRCGTILGFSKQGREKYFANFFKASERAEAILKFISSDEDFCTLCFIPLVCLLVCKSLNIESNLIQCLQNTTEILVSFFVNISKNLPDYGQSQRLSILAYEGVKAKKVLFKEDDLKKHSVDAIVVKFLNLVKLKDKDTAKIYYSFPHLIIQEMFAAAFCVGDKGGSGIALLEEFINAKNEYYFFECNMFEMALHNPSAFERMKKIPDQNYLLSTIRFIFGISNPVILEKLKLNPSPQMKKKLQEFSKGAFSRSSNYKLQPFFWKCLHELHEDKFVRSVMCNVDHLSGSDINCTALTYILLHSTKINNLCLKQYNLGYQELKVLQPGMEKISRTLKSLWIISSTFNKDGLKVFLSIVKNLRIEKIILWENHLTDDFVEDLASALSTNISLRIVDLQQNDLSEGCVPALISMMNTCWTLERLCLSTNRLGDSGVKLLCEAMMNPPCKLKMVWLDNNNLTDSCIKDIVRTLNANSHLSVSLGQNSFTDYCTPSFVHLIKNGQLFGWENNNFTEEVVKILQDTRCGKIATDKGQMT
ncbi:NACHT, LRR and PYD domains-containing protein 3-like isoform X2 [Polypterus senegalus]|uniref:NACHT, LRR and PYD domains-containing protein 3-like isoform X2 n=1 Tax=Polypterus senegalus TaxID=55291 RepID=UPI0019656E1A|nr:NACHT, LRR and PYD domains-containing protein 3-like isoform X2 [Polypterus senegalus]